MEAPNKIYIKPYITTIMSGGLWSCESTELATVPYIRKDVLLEWAKEQEVDAKLATTDGIYYSGREHAFRELIDKLNSL